MGCSTSLITWLDAIVVRKSQVKDNKLRLLHTEKNQGASENTSGLDSRGHLLTVTSHHTLLTGGNHLKVGNIFWYPFRIRQNISLKLFQRHSDVTVIIIIWTPFNIVSEQGRFDQLPFFRQRGYRATIILTTYKGQLFGWYYLALPGPEIAFFSCRNWKRVMCRVALFLFQKFYNKLLLLLTTVLRG